MKVFIKKRSYGHQNLEQNDIEIELSIEISSEIIKTPSNIVASVQMQP